jgi:hypothetical protein
MNMNQVNVRPASSSYSHSAVYLEESGTTKRPLQSCGTSSDAVMTITISPKPNYYYFSIYSEFTNPENADALIRLQYQQKALKENNSKNENSTSLNSGGTGTAAGILIGRFGE